MCELCGVQYLIGLLSPLSSDTGHRGRGGAEGEEAHSRQVSASEYNDFHLDPESDVAKFGDEDGVGVRKAF